MACDSENCPVQWYHLRCVGVLDPPLTHHGFAFLELNSIFVLVSCFMFFCTNNSIIVLLLLLLLMLPMFTCWKYLCFECTSYFAQFLCSFALLTFPRDLPPTKKKVQFSISIVKPYQVV